MAQVRRGVVAVVLQPGAPAKLLIIRRSQLVRSPGKFCFPGGSIEAGETEQEAVVREFYEELGVRVTPVQRLWQSLTITNVQLAWWQVARLDAEPLMPNPAEVESIHWLTVSEALQLEDLLASNRDFYAAWEQGDFELRG
jgi:8-oxo-dGTP diphosphatase